MQAKTLLKRHRRSSGLLLRAQATFRPAVAVWPSLCSICGHPSNSSLPLRLSAGEQHWLRVWAPPTFKIVTPAYPSPWSPTRACKFATSHCMSKCLVDWRDTDDTCKKSQQILMSCLHILWWTPFLMHFVQCCEHC